MPLDYDVGWTALYNIKNNSLAMVKLALKPTEVNQKDTSRLKSYQSLPVRRLITTMLKPRLCRE